MTGFLLAVFGCGAAAAMLRFGADASQMAECTALALDRATGRTYAGPCTGHSPPLPNTLTALLPGSLPEAAAATR